MGKRIIFLDRDGVINEDAGYVSRIEDFVFKEGIFDLLKALSQKGFEFVLITNQSGIGRGYYSLEDFLTLNAFMVEAFKGRGIAFLKTLFCPHAPEEECLCRKPKTGMIDEAVGQFDIDLERSWVIGDKSSDMRLALNAGIPNRIFCKGAHSLPSDGVSCEVIDHLDEVLGIIDNTTNFDQKNSIR